MTTDNTGATEHETLPGSSGLPLLGQTLSFLKDAFGFVERGVAQHGPVFRTNILGRSTAVIVGPEACARWIDPACIERLGAMPPHVKELFGGESLPSLDGVAHANRKQLVLAGFRKDALASYLPALEETLEQYFARWDEKKEFAWVDELKRLAIQAICLNVIGIGPGPELDQLLADYGTLGPGLGSLPIPLPGTAFSRARAGLARIFQVLGKAVHDHQERPRDDGLSRMLAAVTADGTKLGADEAVRELHHIVVAGFIVWGELAAMAMLLDRHPDVRAKVTEEVARVSKTGPVTLETLRAMPYVAQTVMEVKRLCPIVPALFGKAKTSFELGGYTIPKGWMVLLGVYSGNLVPAIYANTSAFDPARFAGPRREQDRHEHAYAPQGPGPAEGHKCPGLDYSTCFMSLYLVHLIRGCTWELPPQDLEYRWGLIPPEPKDGLKVRFARGGPGSS
ncbi:MAG: cytochrome P450 [Polyangiaceae bacterium]